MAKDDKTLKDDEALLEAISPIVNELIDRNYINSKDKIAAQIAPLIGSAIRVQIKSQKDEVVDALYPVMGNMISRYVAKTFQEMLESINKQIQEGLSFRVIKRKIQAKIRGVSETELLLSQNANSNIRALLLIHKESGIVLAHAQNPLAPINEPEMLASMMSAIKSFINDWIEKNQEHKELGEIEFGGNKITIEDAGYSYFAIITDGPLYANSHKKIRKVLESIVVEHGDSIREFHGDLSSFSNMTIYKKISYLLKSESLKQESSKKIHPFLFLLPLILVFFIAWSWYEANKDAKLLTEVKQKLYTTPQITSYRIDALLDSNIISLRGEVPSKFHKDLAESKVSEILGVHGVKNELIIINIADDPMQISSNISYLLQGFNLSYNSNISYTYNYPKVELKGRVSSESSKAKLLASLKKIDGVKEIKDEIEVVLEDIKTTIYFDKASSEIKDSEMDKLIELASLLKTQESKFFIAIDGYSDSSGSSEMNKKLAISRAKEVEHFLKNRALVSQTLKAQGRDELPLELGIDKDSQEARCVIISWKK
ncbi:MAG: BON domain-containing protein [Sulfurimonas sp.]|uniref:BON domain-containing protein n=1 Tax=Sulfurimonas sp. TaxID=2022749 RepID=UPI0025D655ED|nr:BON domain-containing protein [Sulfurimonas sp.]MCK9491473.1 BON domain-containing protein [Sulfurimonas sp.]